MAGLTADGFVAKTFDEIRSGFEARQRATISPNLDTSDYSVIGQLNGIMATEIAALWELGEELYDALDPDKASGTSQDALYSLTDTQRRPAVKSTVVATVMLAPGANIAIGTAQASVSGNPSAKFTNDAAMANSGGSNAAFQVPFSATVVGPVLANAGTLTVIDTPKTGWVSITNALDATPGTLIELDSAYRLRRINELAVQGGSTVSGIKSDLMQLSTVRAAIVLENDTDVDTQYLPKKSIEAIVRSVTGAGDETSIAQSIWRNKPGGIRTYGNTPTSIVDSQGFTQMVWFSRPTERNVYVSVRVTTDPLRYVGDSALKTAIVQAMEDPTSLAYHDVGTSVFAGKIVTAAMSVVGVLNADARVDSAAISNFTAAPTSLLVQQREIANFDTSRIEVVPVAAP